MSSLLPDDYMAGACYDAVLDHAPESGFDESPIGYFEHGSAHVQDEWKPISHSDTFSTHSAFEEPTQSYMLTQSAPVYHHPLASTSLPSTGFAMPPRQFNQPQQYASHFRAALESTPEGQVSDYAPYGSHAASGYAMPAEYMEDGGYQRQRARNTSAPPLPVMAPPQVAFWSPNGLASSAGAAMYGGYEHPSHVHGHSHSHSHSHSHHPHAHFHAPSPMSSSFQESSMSTGSFPLNVERKPSSARMGSRRRPSGVPALSFSGLSASQGAYSPVSVNMTPHSGRSMGSSMSEFNDSQFSPNSTPRSAGSTPRSATSTPRSGVNDKKRSRAGVPHPLERERRVRPKVVAEKGALQCKGVNRKKNTRCRNAALMEYIGPRPLYCAEHITLDPDSFYSKCASTFHKVNGDGKGCREVVLKELQFCHKHYNQTLDVLLDGSEAGFMKARTQLERITALQTQLEAEAVAAKRIDPDLFQRKHKLIPKFMEMKKLLLKRMQEFQSTMGHLMSSPSEFKYEEQTESKDSSSITTSPSGSSDEASCTFDEPTLMMQVEPQNFPVY